MERDGLIYTAIDYLLYNNYTKEAKKLTTVTKKGKRLTCQTISLWDIQTHPHFYSSLLLIGKLVL